MGYMGILSQDIQSHILSTYGDYTLNPIFYLLKGDYTPEVRFRSSPVPSEACPAKGNPGAGGFRGFFQGLGFRVSGF